MDVKALLKRIEGMDAEAQAKAVSAFMSENKRKKTIEENRRDVRAKLFAGCKKLSKAQQESFIFEYLNDNYSFFNNKWLREKHSELFIK